MAAWYNFFSVCGKDGNLWNRRPLSTHEKKKQMNVLCNLNRKMFRKISRVSRVCHAIRALEISDNIYGNL